MDNFRKNCPARMNDSRFLTDYRTPTMRELENMNQHKIADDHDNRSFLQRNAVGIMNAEYDALNTCKPTSCFHKNPTVVTNSQNHSELLAYNNVKLSRISGQMTNVSCEPHKDYRLYGY